MKLAPCSQPTTAPATLGPASMASDLAASCRSRSAIWLAETSSSSCRECLSCCASFSSLRISLSLEASAASSRGPEHRGKLTFSWGQRRLRVSGSEGLNPRHAVSGPQAGGIFPSGELILLCTLHKKPCFTQDLRCQKYNHGWV